MKHSRSDRQLQSAIQKISRTLTRQGVRLTFVDLNKLATQLHLRNRIRQEAVKKASNAVLINGMLGKWFHTTAGIRQGCLPRNPTTYIIKRTVYMAEQVMYDALKDHVYTVSIGDRSIIDIIDDMRSTDYIDNLKG